MQLNRTVWKFVFTKNPGVAQTFGLTARAVPLKAAFQGDSLCVWFDMLPAALYQSRLFCFTATGQTVPDNAFYIDTAIHQKSGTVWHIWEV